MKTVIFYSFKGGVGRTQTMFNTAKYLSSEKNRKIALVDLDLYAPGISYLHNNRKEFPEENYFLQYLVNLFDNNNINKIVTEKLNDNLTIIPAYNMKNIKPYNNLLIELSKYYYSIKVNAHKNADDLSTVADNIFDTIKGDIAKTGDYDYIFFDARTGLTEISDILFSQYSDMKVIVSSYNKQNIEGTNSILELLSESETVEKHNILRVLSPKPKIDMQELPSIKSKADLEDKPNLKEKFNWIGTFEVQYEEKVVVSNFDVWEKMTKRCIYRQNIINLADTLDSNLNEESILVNDL